MSRRQVDLAETMFRRALDVDPGHLRSLVVRPVQCLGGSPLPVPHTCSDPSCVCVVLCVCVRVCVCVCLCVWVNRVSASCCALTVETRWLHMNCTSVRCSTFRWLAGCWVAAH